MTIFEFFIVTLFQSAILLFLRAVNACDLANAAARRRGEEIGRAWQRGLEFGIDLGASRIKDDFDKFFEIRRRMGADSDRR